MRYGRETSANVLIWIAPLLKTGTYLLIAWQLRRWNEAELVFVVGVALVAGLVGIAMLPIARRRRAYFATLYIPVMASFLFLAAFTGVGCGVLGHCL
jgi:H+/Cl- antiporter ClcA